MNITGWPYIILVDGDVGMGVPAWITVDFRVLPSTDTLGQVQYGIESFIALAQAGGLGGDRLDPRQSTATLSPNAPTLQGTRCVWELAALAIDPRSLIVFFNMLTFLGADIQAVAVQVPGSGSGVSFSTEDWAPMWPSVPFYIDDDRSGPNVEVQIEFVRDVSTELQEMVDDAIEAWQSCGMIQGYRDWSAPEDSSFLMPMTDPTFNFIDGNSLVGQFQDIGLVEECYDIFINLLIKLHATIPIYAIELE